MINETAWSSSCSFPTCNVAYHRSVFREAGAFSNHTGGDVEMSARAYKRGFSCVIAHDAIVYHSPPDSVMELIGKFIRYGERPGGSILELLSSILIIILFPVVFVSHFLITLSKRSSRAKSLRVPIVYFAIFEAVRLVLANIGFIKSYLRTTNRVY